MHYFEDAKHRIQADMALRIGKIALQYSRNPLTPDQDFTETLHLCLLQNLLTNCKELMDAMVHNNGEDLGLKVPLSEKADWGLDAVEIREDSFEGNLTVEVLLNHLRNAMSHPTGTDLDAKFPSSGYNSLPDAAGMIRAIGFCNSPDTRNNSPRIWPNHKRHQADSYLAGNQRFSPKSPWSTIPPDVQIESVGHNQFGMIRFVEPYARIFVVVLTTGQLRSLVLGLSNLLAQPVNNHWNGKTIINIIAA